MVESVSEVVAHFDGVTYVPERDFARLTSQLERVKACMPYGCWRTLDGISALTGDPPASISSRLRDLRKDKFGSYVVELRPLGPVDNGLYEYAVCPPVAGAPRKPRKLTSTECANAAKEITQLLNSYPGEPSALLIDHVAWLCDQGKKVSPIPKKRRKRTSMTH
jgi:hypothetical protein